MQKLILHIPHSSTKIPMNKGYVVDQEVLDREILKLTDWYTDDLFSLVGSIQVRADFSRIFCDTERFTDDSLEVMAKFGMGVLYEKADDGSKIRTVSPELRKEVLDHYYWPHHFTLNQSVNDQLKAHGKAIIVDCHSFPHIPLVRDLSKDQNRPDFNIGTDAFHTPQLLIDLSKEFFEERGYSLGVDWPYSGSLVPLDHYQKTKEVTSIMLEINRKLYLKEPTNLQSAEYHNTKKTVNQYLRMIQEASDRL